MSDTNTNHDERQRRLLQEYIFNLEDARDQAEELAVAHEKVKQSQDLLVAVLSSSSHGLSLIRNDAFVWCNRAFTDILGRGQDELIGRTIRLIYPDTEAYFKVQEAISNGSPQKNRLSSYEHDLLHKNGNRIPVLANSRPLDHNDPAKGYVLSVTDFTGLRNAETALKAAYERLEERTGELVRTNQELGREIREHKKTEKKLNKYRGHLEELVKKRTDAARKTNEQLQATTAQLRALSHRLLEVQEIERRNIARELHDEIGQSLTALRIGLKRIQRSKTARSTPEIVDENLKIVEGLIKQIRNMSIELLPSILDDFGLVAALEWYINWLAERAGFTGTFHTKFTEERLSPLIEVTCFRIVQEALTNVVRHSGARNVRVDLAEHDGELHLTVKDDGTGFDVEKMRGNALKGRSFGILGMQERAALAGGRLAFESQAGKGTEVHAYFSLEVLPEG